MRILQQYLHITLTAVATVHISKSIDEVRNILLCFIGFAIGNREKVYFYLHLLGKFLGETSVL
jgi:hypothetical protein